MAARKDRKLLLGTLLAAIVISTIIAAMAINPNGNGPGIIPVAFSTDMAPKEDRGVRMDASIEGKQFTTDEKLGRVVNVSKGETINVISEIRNINNPSIQFAGYSQKLEVFDSESKQVWALISNANTELVNVKPGENFVTGNVWAGKTIEQLENGEYVYPEAQPGQYTLRVTFAGGDFRLADEIPIVIGDASQ